MFFDTFIRYMDASVSDEQRDGAIGSDFDSRVLFVIHVIIADDCIHLISVWKAEPKERAYHED